MAGKTASKSRLSGRRASGGDRSAKRHKGQSGIKQFLQPLRPPEGTAAAVGRDSSEEPDDQLPSQTPAAALLAATKATAVPPTGAPTAMGAGALLQTAVLNSLQHRFVKQQALETPAEPLAHAAGSSNQLHEPWRQLQQGAAPAAAGGQQQQAMQEEEEEPWQDDDDEGDGFQIFSQLAYEPTFLSQRPPEPDSAAAAAGGLDDGAGCGTSQLATQTQLLPPSQCGAQLGSGGSGSLEDDIAEFPSSQLLSQPLASQQQQQGEGAQRRASGVSAASHKTTPALHSAERLQCDGGGQSGQKMFPMFRRREGTKRLYIVRHGESTYNAAAVARGSGWADPQIYDAQLTKRGEQQACALRQELAGLDLPPDTLWVCSPLMRAMQTLLLACPQAHLIGRDGAAGSGGSGAADSGSGSAENSSAAPNGGAPRQPTVVVLPCISEKVATCGDIGHPASHLRKRVPQLAAQLETLPELWWHCPPNKPNCALQKVFGSHESKDQVMSRIGAFRRWLQDRPESVVVAVGHSSYWRTFEEVCRGSKPPHMRNCEFRLIHF